MKTSGMLHMVSQEAIRSFAAALLLVAVFVTTAAAGHSKDSIRLDQANPSWGDTVTFTTDPNELGYVVSLTCWQNGYVVYGASGPTSTFSATLSSLAWIGGAAHCVADLRTLVGNNVKTTASTEFDVLP